MSPANVCPVGKALTASAAGMASLLLTVKRRPMVVPVECGAGGMPRVE
jgi:hypothetical protein